MIPRNSSASFSARSIAVSLAGVLLAVSDGPALMASPPDIVRAAPILVQGQAQSQPDPSAIKRRQQMDAVRNWGYWLSSFEIGAVAAAPHDLLVIDSEISANRSFV